MSRLLLGSSGRSLFVTKLAVGIIQVKKTFNSVETETSWNKEAHKAGLHQILKALEYLALIPVILDEKNMQAVH